ncbi:MAG TPA: prepilin-type N-terminal cleavage/methylation domain-containing protein [Pyrinomonadaceae bacterium]|nr:prepilin-type N-terminal cleavage/methylation domain-containing protein [Pyrinomonadaceae bacterium]
MSAERNIKGFTLIECVIAVVLVMIGFTAIFSLLTACLRTEVTSRELAAANSLSRLKIEELKNSTRSAGGSLTGNVTGFFDSPNTKYTRRWQISADSMGTQTVTVAVLPKEAGALLPEVRLVTRMR